MLPCKPWGGGLALRCQGKVWGYPFTSRKQGQPFLLGELLPAHHSLSGWFLAACRRRPPPPYPPGKLLAQHARQSGEQRGRPRGRASAHKGSEETPSAQGTWAGTMPPLKHPKTPGDGWGEKAASTASQRLPGVPVDQSDPDAKWRKGRLMEAEEYFFFLFSLFFFF